MNRVRLLRSLLVLLALVMMSTSWVTAQDDDPLQVAASTTIIADIARNVGGDLVDVTAIIPAGADVHVFSPSPADVVAIVEADVVLVNGAQLEESLLDIIEENAESEPVVVSYGVEMLAFDGHDHDDDDHDEEHGGEDHADDEEHGDDDHAEDEHGDDHSHYETIGVLGEDAICDEGGHDHADDEEHGDDDHAEDEHGDEDHDHGPCDPHVWMSPTNVAIWVENIVAAFSAIDPDNTDVYTANATVYLTALYDLDTEIREMVATISEENRVLVTNHEFLAYFAADYGFEVVGTVIPAATTMAEVNPQDIVRLVEIIEDEGVNAIFAEVSSNSDVAETVSAESGRDIAVISLYSGSLSAEDEPAATYLDYMRFNVSAIVAALNG